MCERALHWGQASYRACTTTPGSIKGGSDPTRKTRSAWLTRNALRYVRRHWVATALLAGVIFISILTFVRLLYSPPDDLGILGFGLRSSTRLPVLAHTRHPPGTEIHPTAESNSPHTVAATHAPDDTDEAILLDPARLGVQRNWNIHNSDNARLQLGPSKSMNAHDDSLARHHLRLRDRADLARRGAGSSSLSDASLVGRLDRVASAVLLATSPIHEVDPIFPSEIELVRAHMRFIEGMAANHTNSTGATTLTSTSTPTATPARLHDLGDAPAANVLTKARPVTHHDISQIDAENAILFNFTQSLIESMDQQWLNTQPKKPETPEEKADRAARDKQRKSIIESVRQDRIRRHKKLPAVSPQSSEYVKIEHMFDVPPLEPNTTTPLHPPRRRRTYQPTETIPFPTESALEHCPCLRRNLPRFTIIIDKIAAASTATAAGSKRTSTLDQLDSLIDELEACTPMPPACAHQYALHRWASMPQLFPAGTSPPFERNVTNLPPHPPIAILIEPEHVLTSAARGDAPLDPTIPMSPKWIELKLILMRLFNMPGIDPSRIYIFTPTLPKVSTDAPAAEDPNSSSSSFSSSGSLDPSASSVDPLLLQPSIRVPSWFAVDWLTYGRRTAGTDPSAAQLRHARIVSAFRQVHIVDLESSTGSGLAKERDKWRRRLQYAEEAAWNRTSDATTSTDISSQEDTLSLIRSIRRTAALEFRRIRKNYLHWSMLTYLFDPESLPDPLLRDLVRASHLPRFSSLIFLDSHSLPSLDWLGYFTTMEQATIQTRRTTPMTDETIALVSAGGFNEFADEPAMHHSARAPILSFGHASLHSQSSSPVGVTPPIATLSSVGLVRSTGWSTQLVQGGSWLLSRRLYESVRTCIVCWPKPNHNTRKKKKGKTVLTQKRQQHAIERHRARINMQQEAQAEAARKAAQAEERKSSWLSTLWGLFGADDSIDSGSSSLVSSGSFDPLSSSLDSSLLVSSTPSHALLTSSLAEFNKDPCHLTSWDAPFAAYVDDHNRALTRMESTLMANRRLVGAQHLEVIQPLVPRIHRLGFRVRTGLHHTRVSASPAAAAEVRARARQLSQVYALQLTTFMPDRWAWPYRIGSGTSNPNTLATIQPKEYQQALYDRLYSVDPRDIISSSLVHQSIRFNASRGELLPDELDELRRSERAADQRRLYGVDEEVMPCLLSLFLSPASRSGRPAIILLEMAGTERQKPVEIAPSVTAADSPNAVDDDPLDFVHPHPGRMWSLLMDGVGLTFGRTISKKTIDLSYQLGLGANTNRAQIPFDYPVHHDVLAITLFGETQPNLFFLATSSLYHHHYGIGKDPTRRGINYATMYAVFAELGVVKHARSSGATHNAGRSMVSRQWKHVLPAEPIVAPKRFSAYANDPDSFDAIEAEFASVASALTAAGADASNLTLLAESVVRAALPPPPPPLNYSSSLLFPTIPPIDPSWHHAHNCLSLMRGRTLKANGPIQYNPRLNAIRDDKGRKLAMHYRWNIRIPNLAHTQCAIETTTNTTTDTIEAKQSRPLVPPATTSDGSDIDFTPFVDGVCMVIGDVGESCDDVCENMIRPNGDSSQSAPPSPGVGAPSPSSSSSVAPLRGLFRCSAAHFPLVHTFPVWIRSYFHEFEPCAINQLHMQARVKAETYTPDDDADVDSQPVESYHPSIRAFEKGVSKLKSRGVKRCHVLAPPMHKFSNCHATPTKQSKRQRVCPCVYNNKFEA